MTKEEAQANLEKAVLEYLVAHEDERDSTGMMLEGFIAMGIGRSIDGIENSYTINNWMTPENQPMMVTVGLANMLHSNVMAWYRSGITLEDD